jgi:hypothetical protein
MASGARALPCARPPARTSRTQQRSLRLASGVSLRRAREGRAGMMGMRVVPTLDRHAGINRKGALARPTAAAAAPERRRAALW